MHRLFWWRIRRGIKFHLYSYLGLDCEINPEAGLLRARESPARKYLPKPVSKPTTVLRRNRISMSSKATAQLRPSPAKRIRISDVAEHLNLTKGTVSRALNGYPDISESTRTRVRAAADRLGYRPLVQAQTIRTGRSRAIGLILEEHEYDGHSPFVAQFMAGLSEGAAREDWTLSVTTASSEADTLRRLDELVHDKKSDGFILPRTQVDDPRVRFLREADVPFVLYGRTGDSRGCAWFDIESEAAMAEAVSRLAALGHRRIAHVPGAPGYTYAVVRKDGYLRGMEAAGLQVEDALIGAPAVGRAEGRAAALPLIEAGATALVFAVDHAALGAYDAIRSLGLRVGHDVSVISYDGIPEGAYVDPPLSTFRVDTRAAGRRLAELLIRRCRGEGPEALRALAQAQFLDRGSHAGAPNAPPVTAIGKT